MKRIWIALLAVLAIGFISPTGALAKAKPLPIEALQKVYAGKTWFWAEGSAYFAPNGKFYAHSGKGPTANYMEGGWGAYKNGKICFSGTWRSAAGSGFDSSCFLHQGEGKTITQRRNPVGDWYVFKHAKPKKGEEYSKLVKGDWASPQVRKTKRAIGKA